MKRFGLGCGLLVLMAYSASAFAQVPELSKPASDLLPGNSQVTAQIVHVS
jgi:hypothetical protein